MLPKVANMSWQLGYDAETVTQACADADVVAFCELRDGDGNPLLLDGLLPAGWAHNQDLTDPARAASAVAWRIESMGLVEEHEPVQLSRPGKKVRARFLSWCELRHRATGDVRPYGAAHAPLRLTLRMAEWYRNLRTWLISHPRAVVGGDCNDRNTKRVSKRLGVRVIGIEVMFLTVPADVTTGEPVGPTVRGSDHPILGAPFTLPAARVVKEKPVAKRQTYPGADVTSQWHADDHPGRTFDANCGCIHTTETTGWPGYSGGATAPNLTARPDFAAQQLAFRQHFPIDMSSRALKNLTGGVETNTLNVVQIELVGTCNPANRRSWRGEGKLLAGRDYIYWPDAPEWALRDLAAFLRWCNTEHGVPLAGAKDWVRYPESYGLHAKQRFTTEQWRAFRGWCGHQHVPENDHGDPGALNFARVLELVGATPSPVAPAPAPPRPLPLPETELSRTRAQLEAWKKRLGNTRPRVTAAIDAFLKGTPKR